MKRLMAVALAAIFLIGLVPVVDAATQGSCSGSDANKVLLWENSTNDHADGDDNVWVCDNFGYLANLHHDPPGYCAGIWFVTGDTWQDCVSSITVYLDASHALCLYNGSSYSGTHIYPSGGTDTGPTYGTRALVSLNDALTSLKFVAYSGSGQANC